MIVEGSAKVMSEKGDEVLANLGEGDFFGEFSGEFRLMQSMTFFFISRTLSISIICQITENFQSVF